TFDFFSVMVSPGYLKTGYLPKEGENLSFVTTAFGGSVKLSKKVSLNAEYLVLFNSEIDDEMPLSLGVDLETGGHLFQLILSNSQSMHTQALYTSTAGDWTDGKIYFGFNLIREFRIKYY
ncbi:MAG TPA: DUF5777 family beta-barrel protein, partial [Prolixibacteraceae bacterium]|nr:DUF5777 family beta-barrel protein [Prolixibacteraceae bacterium]